MEMRAGWTALLGVVMIGGGTVGCATTPPPSGVALVTIPESPVAPEPPEAPAPSPRKGRSAPRSSALIVTELQSLEALLRVTPAGRPDREGLLVRLRDGYLELAAAETLKQADAALALAQAPDEASRATQSDILRARDLARSRAWEAMERFDQQLKVEYPGR